MKEITLEERKQILLNIMDCIDSFCSQRGLRYYLTGGTLLGAVRHKGFIPWDDDIDIAIPRKDYEIFCKTFNMYALNSCKFVDVETTPNYYCSYGKVFDTRTLLIENIANPVALGVNIDIFPLDYLGDDFLYAKKLNAVIEKYRYRLKMTHLKYGKTRNIARIIVKNIIAFIFHRFSRKKIIEKITKLSKQFADKTDSRFVAIIVMMTYGEKEIMERKWFDNVVKVEFEGRKYNAPEYFHEVLSHFYNDYMQLPPVEKRVTHHSNTAWWKE